MQLSSSRFSLLTLSYIEGSLCFVTSEVEKSNFYKDLEGVLEYTEYDKKNEKQNENEEKQKRDCEAATKLMTLSLSFSFCFVIPKGLFHDPYAFVSYKHSAHQCVAFPELFYFSLLTETLFLTPRKIKNPASLDEAGAFCDPERIRTFDLRLRRALLYPAELRGRLNKKRGMIAHPPRRGGRIRTCDLLVPNQAR